MNENEKKMIIECEENGIRIDILMASELDGISRAFAQKIITKGNVSVNGQVIISKKHKTSIGDVIEVIVPEAEVLNIVAEDIPIDIVYEDDDVIIVNKGKGMVVHPAPGNYRGTLVNAIMFRTENLSSINGVVRPGIVHRIDKDTTGLLMVAKNDNAHRVLAEQLKEKTTVRRYWALVHGRFHNKKGLVSGPIARNPNDRLKMAIVKGGKDAVTHYKVVEEYAKYSLIELRLETGRTHQIRVHMTSIGHPIVGDPVYGSKKEKVKHDGQLLHAKTLGFVHPTTKEYIEFDSELPENFKEIMEKVKHII